MQFFGLGPCHAQGKQKQAVVIGLFSEDFRRYAIRRMGAREKVTLHIDVDEHYGVVERGGKGGYITSIDHWIAFILLAFIGGKMVVEGW